MLERIREGSQGPWAMIIIGLVVLSFVFAGVGSYLTSSGSTAVAKVNGEEIDQATLERAYENQRARMEQQYGDSVAAMFSNEGYLKDFRRNVLEQLINNKVVEQQAAELGLRVSDAQVKETIRQMQAFQTAGEFDNERYLAVLRQSGFQPADFRDYLRTELTREQLTRALGVSSFALTSEVNRAWDLQSQTRDGEYLTINSQDFADSVEISQQDLENYYQANITAFDTQEKVNLAYVTLSVDDLKSDVNVSEQQIEDYYQNNRDRYREEEERRVSHILIEFGDDKDAARKKAESLHQELEQGADFATLAEESSDDTFSAENGGDLSFISRDMMDPAFDESAFGLAEVGDVSQVVETDFGYHIIKLTEIKPEQVTDLADVKDEIRSTLQQDQAMERFYELRARMDEVAFEVPDTLQDVAGVANQPVQETGLFARSQAPESVSNAEVLSLAFSPELIEDRMNSEVIELDENSVIVVRVKEHEAQRTRELSEVKSDIETRLRAEKSQQAAVSWAEELLTSLTAGEDVQESLQAHSLSWQSAEKVSRNPGELPRAVVDSLFTLSMQEGQSLDVTELANGDVAVVRLTAVHKPDAPAQELVNSLRQRLGQAYGQSAYQSYVNGLRSEAEVEILVQ